MGTVAGAGHLLAAERAERVAEELDAFVSDVAPVARGTALLQDQLQPDAPNAYLFGASGINR